MVRLATFVFVLFAACAAGQATPNLPGTYGTGEPLPPPVEPGTKLEPPAAAAPAAGADPGAEADFRNAQARFEAGDREGARAALEAFRAQHQDHAFRPTADLMLARLALVGGDAAAAKRLLEPLAATPPDPGTGSSARYYLGISEVRLGRYAHGRELLLPFLPPAGTVGANDEALVELRGALAEAAGGLGEVAAALALFDGYARGGREHEKAYARTRAAELVADVQSEAAVRIYRTSPEKGLARALLGPKVAAALRAQGDSSGAATVESETAGARRAAGFEVPSSHGQGGGDPGKIGLAVALSGKFQPVGEAAVRAAMLATGAPGGGGGATLHVRDTGGEPEQAGKGVLDLANEENVIGILAASDRRGATPALAAAGESGVPTLVLDDAPPVGAPTAFQLIHAPEARVGALVRAAHKLGARDFGVLGPDSAAGKRLREAFRREVAAVGGRLTGEGTYAPGATSFQSAVAALKKAPPQAVFVADGADRLELIAPALAAADLWPAPWGAPRPAGAPGKAKPRNVLLLSTAGDLSPRLIQNAGRYVQGALLSPGFYPDQNDARARAFLEQYRAAYGQDPRATDAYAYDGVAALRSVTAGGARTRGEVLSALAGAKVEGLTGAMRFGPDHGRSDPPRLYVVEGDDIRLHR